MGIIIKLRRVLRVDTVFRAFRPKSNKGGWPIKGILYPVSSRRLSPAFYEGGATGGRHQLPIVGLRC